jgi:hypothetical protein
MNENQDYYDSYRQNYGTYDTGLGGVHEEQAGSGPYIDDFYSYDDDYDCEHSL